MNWESVWSRSVAGDALPASLRELRCVSTPAHVVVREFIFLIKTVGRAYDCHPDGQRSSRPQSCIVVVICPCDPGWYPIISSVLQTKFHKPKLSHFASSTPFMTGRPYTLIFNGSMKSSGAVGLALRWFPPSHRHCLPRPPRHNCSTKSNSVRPSSHHRPFPSLKILQT